MRRAINGTIRYIDLEMGFWGIETDKGNFQPIDFPEQLKSNGALVECTIESLDDMMTMQNWGQVCRILAFKTL